VDLAQRMMMMMKYLEMMSKNNINTHDRCGIKFPRKNPIFPLFPFNNYKQVCVNLFSIVCFMFFL